jgi:paraquat-inducible protein A
MSAHGSALAQGLVGCHACTAVSRLGAPGAHQHCPRCGATLHARKPDSLARTWALLIASAILYVPAMAYPITIAETFGQTSKDTILSGVEYLYTSGQAPIAILVFVASIAVPLLKLIVLASLLISVQCGSRWRPKDRTVLYRLTEWIGRWSMLDIFVVMLLVALVQIGSLATFYPGPGAAAFATVVVLTMLAAMSFDPRLIWDRMELPAKDGTKEA